METAGLVVLILTVAVAAFGVIILFGKLAEAAYGEGSRR